MAKDEPCILAGVNISGTIVTIQFCWDGFTNWYCHIDRIGTLRLRDIDSLI
jgi:hypothetical protein